jgi:C4-dicarboxylate-specific signal transduction histidine kinase
LQQVALNLILNAVDAMSSVEAGPWQLVISTEETQAHVLVKVCDSEPGIDPEISIAFSRRSTPPSPAE